MPFRRLPIGTVATAGLAPRTGMRRGHDTCGLRRLLLAIGAAALLAGCAGAYLAKPPEPRTGVKITSAAIAFDESTMAYMPVRVSKTAAAYGHAPPKPVISDSDKQQAQRRVRAVIDAYREHAPRMLRSKLAAEGVQEGYQTEIALRPQWVSVSADNGAVDVAFEVSVRQRGASGIWKVVPIANNVADGPYWSLTREPGIGDEADVDLTRLVDSFSSATIRAMSQAGWFR